MMKSCYLQNEQFWPSGLYSSGKSTEAHLCVALARIPGERAVHLAWVLRKPCLPSRTQTSLNFAYWIKGSISFPLHFLQQDQSHPSQTCGLMINPTEAKLLLAMDCCVWLQSSMGKDGGKNKGWEQSNKHPTFDKAPPCHVLQDFSWLIYCKKICFCQKCYLVSWRGFVISSFLWRKFGVQVVCFCCFLSNFSLFGGSRDVPCTHISC